VKQLRVAVGVSKRNDADDRGVGDHRQRLPLEVAMPDVRLGENDEANRLMSSDEPELISGHPHLNGSTPVVLIDRLKAKGRVFHSAILSTVRTPGNVAPAATRLQGRCRHGEERLHPSVEKPTLALGSSTSSFLSDAAQGLPSGTVDRRCLQQPGAAMRRVAIVGSSGSGKTTLARRLAARLDLPLLELDSVFHQAGWTELPLSDFRSLVAEFAAGESWVIDGNYSRSRDLVLDRADTVVWLRLPRRVVMRQVLRRTSARVLFRRELWNGNRERPRSVLSRDPARSIVTWAWTMYDKYDEEYEALRLAAPAGQRWVVLRCRREVEHFLAQANAG
jgi:adenylate kinase family enzyme